MLFSTSKPESESDFPVPLSFGAGLDFPVIPDLSEATANTGARIGANAFTTDAGLGAESERITPSSWLWSDERRNETGNGTWTGSGYRIGPGSFSGGSNGNGFGGDSGGGDERGL